MSDTRPLEQVGSEPITPTTSQRSRQQFAGVQLALLGLVAIRLIVASLFMLNILPLDLRIDSYPWYLHHGGDQDIMFAIARSIIHPPLVEAVVGIGQPLTMLPWVLLLEPAYYLEILTPLVLINGYLLGGLSVLLVGGLAQAVTGSDRVALGAAALWALVPLATYGAFFWHPSNVLLQSANVPKIAWLNGLSDGPATFFLLLSAFLLARILQHDRVRFWWAAATGLALGITVLYRFHLVPAVGFLLLTLLIFRGWRALLTSLGTLLLAYLPQAWYNTAMFGMPFTTGYISVGDVANWGGTLRRPLSDLLRFLPVNPSPANVLSSILYFVERHMWVVLPLAVGLAIAAYAFVHLKQRNGWQSVFLLIGLPASYLLPLLAAYVFRDDLIRFSMPVMPILLIVAVFTAEVALERFGVLKDQRAALSSGEHA